MKYKQKFFTIEDILNLSNQKSTFFLRKNEVRICFENWSIFAHIQRIIYRDSSDNTWPDKFARVVMLTNTSSNVVRNLSKFIKLCNNWKVIEQNEDWKNTDWKVWKKKFVQILCENICGAHFENTFFQFIFNSHFQVMDSIRWQNSNNSQIPKIQNNSLEVSCGCYEFLVE